MSITAANSVLTLTIPGVFSAPQRVQGYSADDAFMTDAVELAETMMGVDGLLSSGYTPAPTNLNVTLQADSPSLVLFNTWAGAIKAGREIITCDASVLLPGNGWKYTLTLGTLITYTLIPDVKKVLQPPKYVIRFQDATAFQT